TLVAICTGIAAHSLGASSERSLSNLTQWLPLAATAGSLLLVFLLLTGLTFYLTRKARRLQNINSELSRLALVAAKTDSAAFITNPDGNIQWVNDGFVRLTGHAANDALGKQPGPLLLGQLQNIKVTQKIRDSLSHRRAFTVEMLCSNRRGHRFWMSLNMTPAVDEQGQVTHFVGIGADITARRKAEDEVAKVGRRSELLLNSAADGILGFDLEGLITFVNASAGHMTGYTSDELIGKSLSMIIRQLRVSRDESSQDDLFAGAAFIDGSVQIGDANEFRKKDGTYFPVEFTSTPVCEGSDLIGSVVVFRDITTRLQSDIIRSRQMRQAALRADVAFALASGDSLRGFLARAMLCVVKCLDGAFARVWTLNVADSMLELQASAGIYSHINGHHSRIPVGTLKVGKVAQSGTPQISTNLLADPDILDKDWIVRERMVAFIGFPLFLEGNLVGVMAMYSRNALPDDAMELFGCISDSIAQGIGRKHAEESGGRQAALLDRANDAILVIGMDDRVSFRNAAADRLYGWKDGPPNQHAAEFILADKSTYEQAKVSALQDGEWCDEYSSVLRDNELIPIETSWSLVSDDTGDPRGFIVVQTETRTRRELEAHLLSNQRGETVSLLARGLAHRLTDTFLPILVAMETLKVRLAADPAADSIALLEGNAHRGLDLVRQVLTLTEPSDSEGARPRTAALLENVIEIIRGTLPKTIQIRNDMEASLWPLPADPVEVQQALLSFAIQAKDQMPDGGALTVTIRNVCLKEGSAELQDRAAAGCYVRFTFENTGLGLDAEALARWNHRLEVPPPSATDAEMAGWSALQILHKHRGFSRVANANPGSYFAAYFPAEQPIGGVPVVQEPATPGLPNGNGELILVVDDEPSLLTITKEALECFGYRALTAADGAEAVAAFSSHRNEIKAVITDMIMPNMDGPATIRVLRKLQPTIPIIASSGMMDPGKVREMTGMNDLSFLEKPYSADTLRHSIHRVLQKASGL
ncbi:MAG TPA: PAS domain S-box protein, partial [Verrucomicrobiae bacterium]|nr:PAS domain S-box protein [Verrucomicrobiae bacterium]